MKNKVKFSTISITLTAVILISFAAGIFALRGTGDVVVFCVIAVLMTVTGLYFCPVSVEADNSGITLRRFLSRAKVFEFEDIKDVETCRPSAGGIRLCGSGGFFGYWGYFNDIMLGSYFGYYGSADNCFIVELKSGKRYVLGCENQSAMVKYIKGQIDKE